MLQAIACNKYESQLIYARAYEVVGEGKITLNSENRNAHRWFITSDAGNYDEFAQTTILAALDLHKKNKKCDLVHVILIPDKELMATGVSYAFAYYALDKKGLKDVSGADQNTMTSFKWKVRSAEKPLNDFEFEVAKLWYKHQSDFPSEDLLSSLGYNMEKLVKFIADSLSISEEEVYLPHIITKEYKELDFLDR